MVPILSPFAATSPPLPIAAVILAGGRASRFGGAHKGLLPLAGRPLVAHLLERHSPWLRELWLSCNEPLAYAALGLPTLPDLRPEHPGPLAGVEAALVRCGQPWLLTLPCDTPLLPPDLAPRLLACAEQSGAEALVAHDGVRAQNGVLLLRRELAPALSRYLDGGGHSIHGWLAQVQSSSCTLADAVDAFTNINTQADLEALRARLEPTHG